MAKALIPLLLGVLLSWAWAQSGQALYGQYCASCHQAGGQGLPGAFPPLAGHVQEILTKKDGRAYLIQVVLFGLQGQIRVRGQTYSGVMPGWAAQLKDEQVAAILNHVATSFGNRLPPGQGPFTPQEVARERAKRLTPDRVYALRRALGL